MDYYRVRLTRGAETEFRAVPFPFRRQINQRLSALKLEPRPPGAERLAESESYRLLIAGWRVLYSVDEERGEVTIFAVTG